MTLSVLIRNLNEATELERTLEALKLQQSSFPYEIVLVDNASTDESVRVAERFGCKIITISQADFSYGGAINLGLQHCKGEIVLLLSAHIKLLGPDFLEKIVAAFTHEKIAFARPVNVSKAKLVDASGETKVLEWSLNSNENESRIFLENNWTNLLIANCSAVKRSVALDFPFNTKIEASEDKLWSRDVLKAGYKGIYNMPCYFYYSKKTDYRKRLEIDYKELKTKTEILNKPYFAGSEFGFVVRSMVYAIRAYWPKVVHETKLASRLAKLGKTSGVRY